MNDLNVRLTAQLFADTYVNVVYGGINAPEVQLKLNGMCEAVAALGDFGEGENVLRTVRQFWLDHVVANGAIPDIQARVSAENQEVMRCMRQSWIDGLVERIGRYLEAGLTPVKSIV